MGCGVLDAYQDNRQAGQQVSVGRQLELQLGCVERRWQDRRGAKGWAAVQVLLSPLYDW